MSFRRRRDDWDDFVARHRIELLECGIPGEIIDRKMRFFVFVEHGYDEFGYHENPHSVFNPEELSDDQVVRLANIVGLYDQMYGQKIAAWRAPQQ